MASKEIKKVIVCPEFKGECGETGVCGIASEWGPGFDASCTTSDREDFTDHYPLGALGEGDTSKGIERFRFEAADPEAQKRVNNSRCPWLTSLADIPRNLENNPQT